jgi:hypothetical protein
MGDTEPTSRERYREIKRLYDEAAKDDWRGPVKIIPGITDRMIVAMAKYDREHPEQATSGPKAPSLESYGVAAWLEDPLDESQALL